MEDERIARALNLLRENVGLYSADCESLVDLIEDYFNDHATAGKLAYCPTQQLLFLVVTMKFISGINTNKHKIYKTK